MPQNLYVLFSIDIHFSLFDLWVEAVLCPRKGMSYLALTYTSVCLALGGGYTVPQNLYVLFSIDTHFDVFDL